MIAERMRSEALLRLWFVIKPLPLFAAATIIAAAATHPGAHVESDWTYWAVYAAGFALYLGRLCLTWTTESWAYNRARAGRAAQSSVSSVSGSADTSASCRV